MRTVVFIKNFILSVVLFPIDLIRITLFFLRAHLLLLLGPFIRFLAGRSQNVLKACNQTQPSGYSKTNTQPGCGQTRWFQNKRLYHIVCRNFFILPGSGGRNIGCCAHRGGFHTSFVRSILAGLILGAIWVSLAGGVSLITKRIRITQSAVNSPAMHAAREFERDASTLFSTGEFARARIQYLNAIKKAPGLVSSMWGLARCEMQLDQVDKATRTLKKITQLDSGHVRAHLML
ncbi:MAG: tetratricopeptide repeat protein, partial [Verrucomicrobia bacterium]|nr:tetratricopeptide repeat protein [Verrucomicrobiota bacterium]